MIWPIIKHGKTVDRSTVGAILIALRLKKPELVEFGENSGSDLLAIGKWIDEVNGSRNKGAHAIGMSFVEVQKLREKWLGAKGHDGGIFGALFVKD